MDELSSCYNESTKVQTLGTICQDYEHVLHCSGKPGVNEHALLPKVNECWQKWIRESMQQHTQSIAATMCSIITQHLYLTKLSYNLRDTIHAHAQCSCNSSCCILSHEQTLARPRLLSHVHPVSAHTQAINPWTLKIKKPKTSEKYLKEVVLEKSVNWKFFWF